MAGALRADDGNLTPQLARALFEISYVLGYNAAGVGIGVVILGIAAVALRSKSLMASWLAVLLLIVGLAFLTPLSIVLIGPAVGALAITSVWLIAASTANASRRRD